MNTIFKGSKKAKQACFQCRRRKVKCTGEANCQKCVDKGFKCEYQNDLLFFKTVCLKTSNVPSGDTANVKLINTFKTTADNKVKKNKTKMMPAKSAYTQLDEAKFATPDNYATNRFYDDVYYNNHHSATSFADLGLCSLPSKSDAFLYMQATWTVACISFRFYHRTTVYKLLESIYDMKDNGINMHDLKNYNYEQRKALPLFYLIFALGVLFKNESNVVNTSDKPIEKDSSKIDMNNFIHKINQLEYIGLNYFESGKKLTNFITASDNRTIQTLFMMSLYCQFTARLTESYTYNSLALTLLIKKGFYKKHSSSTFDTKKTYNPLQLEVVKRMFWASYKTEIYMSTILGYPIKLKLDDITQEFPIDANDENISDTSIIMDNETDMISSCGINNVHTRLMLIMYEIKEFYNKIDTKSQYPAFSNEIGKSDSIDVSKLLQFVSHIESRLDNWVDGLPDYLKPSNTSNHINDEFLRINKLLHLDYLNIKLMLYKPFLIQKSIFISDNMEEKCVSTCVEIINLSEYMWNRRLLVASYWFSQYTIFFAIGVLSFLKNKMKTDFDNILDVRLHHGIDLVNKLKDCSVTSMFIYNELIKIFHLDNETSQSNTDIDTHNNNIFDIDQSIRYIPNKSPEQTRTFDEDLNIFNEMKTADEKIFEGMEFFEAASGTPFEADKVSGGTIFEQFNNLFR